MLFATVPAAPPTLKNQRTTSCPAPISAKVPYQRGSRLILSALEWVSIVASFISVRTEDVLNPLANETREFLFQAINRLMQAALQHGWVSAGSGNRQVQPRRIRPVADQQPALPESRDPSTLLRMTMPPALSLHSVERFLQKLKVGRVASFFASGLNPLFLERVFGRTIGFVEHAEDSWERELRQFVSCELVGDVVPQLVLGCIVPFLFLDHFETAAFLRISRIKDVGEKFDALRQTFDGAEALVIERLLA